jgi:hypothetical protein
MKVADLYVFIGPNKHLQVTIRLGREHKPQTGGGSIGNTFLKLKQMQHEDWFSPGIYSEPILRMGLFTMNSMLQARVLTLSEYRLGLWLVMVHHEGTLLEIA